MDKVNPFDRYLYLAQEIHNLPLFTSIPRINSLITKALQANPAAAASLDPMMNRYNTALTQTISLTLSRNIQQDPATMLAMWTQYATDETAMLESVLDITNFKCICSMPLAELQWTAYGLFIPEVVREFWSIVTAIQFFLPIIAAAQKRYVEVYNQKISFAIMLCIVKNFLSKHFPQGWEYINKRIYHAVSGNVENIEESLATILLVEFGNLELNSTKYINMFDIDRITDGAIDRFLVKPFFTK